MRRESRDSRRRSWLALSEETATRPKPMVDIGGRPILRRTLTIYSLLRVGIDTMANAYPKSAFEHPITDIKPFAKPPGLEST